MEIQYSNDANNYQRSPIATSAQSKSALVNFLINKHVVKTEGQANIVLVIFIIVGFAITIRTIFG